MTLSLCTLHFFSKYEIVSAQNIQALHSSVSIWNINLIIPLVSILRENRTMDECHFRKIHIFMGGKEIIFSSRNILGGHRLSIIACIHLEDLTEIPDITPIRCQNLPDYMMEGSEGETFRKCISFLDQLN